MKCQSVFLFLLFKTLCFAQNTTNTWVVKTPPYADRSRNNLLVERVELTDNATIIDFIFDNRRGETNLMSICNSFKIYSSGKVLATFVDCEPHRLITNVEKGFHCAELPEAIKVEKGQTVRFRLFFTPIPKDTKIISLVEYNGKEPCEYDVFGVDISKKNATISKKTIEPTQPIKKTPPPIAKKQVEKTPKKEAPKIITETKTPKKEESKIIVQPKTLVVKTRKIDIEIWDNDKEDGDIITLKLNDKIILENKEVKTAPFKMSMTLTSGENTLVMEAVSLGTKGKNTAAFKINDGVSTQERVLNSDMGVSAAIKIVVD